MEQRAWCAVGWQNACPQSLGHGLDLFSQRAQLPREDGQAGG
ncbi:hypothetical protein [Streptomyces sp. NPDC048111]